MGNHTNVVTDTPERLTKAQCDAIALVNRPMPSCATSKIRVYFMHVL